MDLFIDQLANGVSSGVIYASVALALVIIYRTTGLLKLGVSTNAARAKSHTTGRRLSKELYDRFATDGILYASRLTSAECVAVYDRAVAPKLVSTPAVNLVRNTRLIDALRSLSISVRGA